MHRHKKQRHKARRAKEQPFRERGYSSRNLDAAINRAKSIPREVALKKVKSQPKINV